VVFNYSVIYVTRLSCAILPSNSTMTARSAPIPVASLLRPPPAPGTAGGHRSGPDGDPNRAHERARAEPPATTTSHRGSPGGAADPIQDSHKPSVGGLQEISDMRLAGSCFSQSEHVPLIKCYSTTRDRTLPPPIRRLGFRSHRSPTPAAAVLRRATCHLRGRRRLSSSACCNLRMPPGWPHPRFCAYRTLPNAAFPSPTMMPSLSSKHSVLARAH